MKTVKITCEPYHFSTILSCDIFKTVNHHFEANISGYIEDSLETIMEIGNCMSPLIIYGEDDGERKSIFRGKVASLKIRVEGDLQILTIAAKSNTCCLDEKHHMRTFQDPDATYRDIVNFIVKKIERTAVIYCVEQNGPMDGLTVQYDESDWDFLKRLAARQHTILVPDCTNDTISFYFGIPNKAERVSAESEYFELSVDCLCNHSERNVVEYHLTSREVWELCTHVKIQGQELLVYQIHGSLIGGELVWEYRLRRSEDFELAESYNTCMIGASIFGRVSDTKTDMVKLHLECEDDFPGKKGLWFPFATVYTSSDGNGWYFMPEHGERVRLSFPDEKEKNAYVTSATYLEDIPGQKNDPDIKFIRTSHGKEIRLAPDYILITNHKGMWIRLDDEKGIEIKSSRNIEVVSEAGMVLSSQGKLKIESETGLLLKQNENSIVIRDGIWAEGLRVQFK